MKQMKWIMLALAAIAMALPVCAQGENDMTYQGFVDALVLPMALANDTPGKIKETFTDGELARVAAAAEENGLAVPESLVRALEGGEGYWEEETIMALAKAQFGPIPARWTLEAQYWFEETVVAIGFKEYNSRRVPGEGGTELRGGAGQGAGLSGAAFWRGRSARRAGVRDRLHVSGVAGGRRHNAGAAMVFRL